MAVELQKADAPRVPHLRAVGPDERLTPPPPVAPAPEPAELNCTIFSALVRWVKDTHGQQVLDSVLEDCDLKEEDFSSTSSWTSMRQLNRLLKHCHALAGSDEEFKKACTYQMSAGYGPLRFIVMAATPKLLLTLGGKSHGLVSRISSVQMEYPSPGRAIGTYRSKLKEEESRLMCLSRQATTAALPTMWGLPPAQMEHHECIAQGGDACIYEMRYYEPLGVLRPLAGALTGVVLWWALAAFGIGLPGLWFWLPLLGGMTALLFQLAKGNKNNLTTGEEINEALRTVIEEHTEARSEILELNRRQREWTKTLEHQVQERTSRLEGMVDRLRTLDHERESNIRGVSHDLRNPLSLLHIETELLRDKLDLNDPDARELVEGHKEAVDQMHELINHMMREATEDLHRKQHSPEAMNVEPMVGGIRRRLKALVHGRDIRTSVFSTREMPTKIWCHPIVFDRVVDNLLTNAVKYTPRGSIIVELDGTPGFLSIKISDTGGGIPADQLEGIFHPRGNGNETSPESYGVGLSVVVSLLDELGGKLEVMSRVDTGTTFWAHFPTKMDGPTPTKIGGSAVERVVTIRPPVER